MFTFISGFTDSTSCSFLLLLGAIVLLAAIFEDATTIIVGVLAADDIIPIPVALLFLYIGIFIGDATLYALGWLARSHPRLARYLDHDFTTPVRLWLESRYALKIFSGHFVPGLRTTTYAASGFFRRPLPVFIPMEILGGLVLEAALFSVSYWFGNATSGWVSHARWGIAAAFLIGLFFVGRHNLLAYRSQKVPGDAPGQNGL